MKLTKYLSLSVLHLAFILTSCVSTQKYNLLVQSAQKNQIEKQLLRDSLITIKEQSVRTIYQKDSIISQKSKALDSLTGKYALLQVSYIDLEKNVFEKNQDFQNNAKSYLSQIAQRDSLLRQIITQSKTLMAENQKLSKEVEKLQKGVLSASISPSLRDSLQVNRLDSMYAKLTLQMKNYIGQEIGIAREVDKIRLLFSHQLLFQGDTLSEDGSFMLTVIAKILKEERNTAIAMKNYTNQEMAEKDNWETGVMQSLSIIKALNENGLKKEQITHIDVGTTPYTKSEIGVAIQRFEIWVSLSK